MIDLHTHSTVSDGSDPPERIPELAAEAGCSAVALTDHDSLVGLVAARKRAAELDVTLIPGCEVSCRSVGKGGMHVLVYFVEDDDGPLSAELTHLRVDRHHRNIRLADKLASMGLPITYAEVVAEAGGEEGIGRPHFASVLVKAGAADSIQDAFDRFLANGRPGFVPKSRLEALDVARLATASGGVAVLAHPYSLELEGADLAALVGELAAAGFGGIEAIYGRYSPRQRQDLSNLARRFDLVATGGSDHHGTIKPDLTVGTGRGDLKVPDQVLIDLEARRPAA
jgi:predicted metal-dependent phosphoesterase TrpH